MAWRIRKELLPEEVAREIRPYLDEVKYGWHKNSEEMSEIEHEIDVLEHDNCEGKETPNTVTSDKSSTSSEGKSARSMRNTVRDWALKGNVSRKAVNEVLSIMRGTGVCGLPQDRRTLFRTPENVSDEFVPVKGGIVWYDGIQKSTEKELLTVPDTYWEGRQNIELDFFFDGLSPYNSKTYHVWPILARLHGRIQGKLYTPFLIGFYAGKDPKFDVDEYLEMFILEANDLQAEWIFRGKTYKLLCKMFIADAPARALLKKTNPHNSCIACDYCTADVKKVKGVLSYHKLQIERASLRTDESFCSQQQKAFHRGCSPFIELKIGMITQWPPDPMHLLSLGVMKRILKYLFKNMQKKDKEGKQSTRINKCGEVKIKDETFHEMRNALKINAKYYPSEFARRPTDFKEYSTLKATEYRRILMYDVVWLFLRKGVPNDCYKNIMDLHCAIRILSTDDLLRHGNAISDAHTLLCRFVSDAEKIHGKPFVCYGIHLLTHLAPYCKTWGNLNNFAAYPFENYLREIKMKLLAPGRVAEQLICRFREIEEKQKEIGSVAYSKKPSVRLAKPHQTGPLPMGVRASQYHTAHLQGHTIRVRRADSVCIMKCGTVAMVRNIIQEPNAEATLLCVVFKKKKNLYNFPIPSSIIGEYLVSDCDEANLTSWRISSVKTKCILIPAGHLKNETGWYICIELSHDVYDQVE